MDVRRLVNHSEFMATPAGRPHLIWISAQHPTLSTRPQLSIMPHVCFVAAVAQFSRKMRKFSFSLLLVVGAIVLGLLASDVMAKKAKMTDDEDEDAEVIDIEDFSWDIADLGEEVCLDYCKEKRKRPVLCQVIGQLAGMSADHTIGSINRFLSHRAKKILSKYKEPIFQMELRAKLRETTDEVLTSGTRNATEIREAFNKRYVHPMSHSYYV